MTTTLGPALVEVMRTDLQCLVGESVKPQCFHMDDAILILQRPFRQDEFAAGHDQALPFVEIRCDDDVRDAGFVFHREKDETLCGSRPLPRNDASSGSYNLTISAIP